MLKFFALLSALAMPWPLAVAEESQSSHPSTHAEVRLASWWMARHAEKIAEIE